MTTVDECECPCHTGGAFRPPCSTPGGCGPHEDERPRCKSSCVNPLHRRGFGPNDPGRPCERCAGAAVWDLHALPSLDARLQVEDIDGFALGWTSGDNLGRSQSGKTAPIPGNLEALNLRGPAAGVRVGERLVPVWRTVLVPPPSTIPAVYDTDGRYGQVGRLLKAETVLDHPTWRREPVLDPDTGEQLWAPDGDQHGADPLPATVWRWVHDVHDGLALEGWPAGNTIAAATAWIEIHFERAVQELPVTDGFPGPLAWCNQIRATAGSLRSILGDNKPYPQYIPNARCPTCKLADLWRPPDDDCIECHSCQPATVLRGEKIREVLGEEVRRLVP